MNWTHQILTRSKMNKHNLATKITEPVDQAQWVQVVLVFLFPISHSNVSSNKTHQDYKIHESVTCSPTINLNLLSFQLSSHVSHAQRNHVILPECLLWKDAVLPLIVWLRPRRRKWFVSKYMMCFFYTYLRSICDMKI